MESYVITETAEGMIFLQKKTTVFYSQKLSGKSVPINIFNEVSTTSVKELFIYMLYDTTNEYEISDNIKSKVLAYLDQLYYEDVEQGCVELSIQQRYLMLQRYSRGLSYQATTQKPRLAEHVEKLLVGSNDSEGISYNELTSLIIKESIALPSPVVTSLCFSSGDDILVWALEWLISHNTKLCRCQNCAEFFIHSSKNRVYCSVDCQNKYNQLSQYFHNEELGKAVKKNSSAFTRKTGSNQCYMYNDLNLFLGMYDEKWMFSHEDLPESKQWKGRLHGHYVKEDFVLMKKSYDKLYNKEYKKCASAYYDFLSRSISQEEYNKATEHFLWWLAMVREQLNGFKIIKK